MSSIWKIIPLAEVVDLHRGFELASDKRIPGPYPVLSAGTIAGSHSESRIKGPGFAIGRATNLGVPVWSDSDFWPLNTTLYASDFKGNDPRWLYHLFQTMDLSGYDSGSVQPMLNRNYISDIPISVPPIQTQHAIAEVLSALDEKIAASSQIVSSGLHLIDAIYLRTPKHRSESTFEEVATVKGGATPSTKVDEFWNGPHNWATPSDITALDGPWLSSTDRKITDSGLQKITSDLYPSGSILMTSRASIGHYAIAAEPTAVNQGFIVLNAHDSALQPWLFAQLRHRTSEFIAWANGATFLELPKGVFKKLPVDLPEAPLDEYAAKVNPLLDRIRTAQQESRTLAATRDELLPLLMSGKITVADAEKRITE